MLLIYVLMVGWFQSFTMPFVILAPIPLSLVGILPALMAGAVAATLLSRYAVPVLYFMLARRGRAAELHREGALAEPLALSAPAAGRAGGGDVSAAA